MKRNVHTQTTRSTGTVGKKPAQMARVVVAIALLLSPVLPFSGVAYADEPIKTNGGG
jgi:hypothetical protein